MEKIPDANEEEQNADSGDGGDEDDFTASMPGALTLAQVLLTIDLDRVRVNVGPHFCTADVSS